MPAAIVKEVSFAVVSMIADTYLRMRDMESFCDIAHPLPGKEVTQKGNY